MSVRSLLIASAAALSFAVFATSASACGMPMDIAAGESGTMQVADAAPAPAATSATAPADETADPQN